MAINQLKKSIIVANAYKENDGTLKSAALFPIDIEGRIRFKQAGVFLLNPTSVTETKSSNWAQQTVPGQSDPVMQWTSSGPRVLSFQALVTADTSDFVSGQKTEPGKDINPLNRMDTVIGGIASRFFKVAAPTERVDAKNGTELDIKSYLNYYRSLLYPEYDKVINPRRLTASPPLCVLLMGNSVAKFPYGDKVTAEHDLWVVTNLEINITKFLPNLAPMEAVVSFQLTQYNIRSFDRNRFLSQDY